MEWNQILKNKKQCSTWKDEVIDKSIIDSILTEVHEHCNSKQNRVPIQITVLDWTYPEKRDFILKYSQDLEHPSKHQNTQVLAPWIICFSIRDVPSLSWNMINRIGNIEVGLAAQMTVLSAVDKGLDIGFCKCFQAETGNKWEKYLGFLPPDLIIGLGHYENKTHQRNYYTREEIKANISTIPGAEHYGKPSMEEYIKYYV